MKETSGTDDSKNEKAPVKDEKASVVEKEETTLEAKIEKAKDEKSEAVKKSPVVKDTKKGKSDSKDIPPEGPIQITLEL